MIDGMALVCQSTYIGLTYNKFADNILTFLATMSSGASRIDIVFDGCQSNSILNTERYQLLMGNIQLKTIVGAVSIKQLGAVLSDENNKRQLITVARIIP